MTTLKDELYKAGQLYDKPDTRPLHMGATPESGIQPGLSRFSLVPRTYSPLSLHQDKPRTTGPSGPTAPPCQGKQQRGNFSPNDHREHGNPTGHRSHAKYDQGRNRRNRVPTTPRSTRHKVLPIEQRILKWQTTPAAQEGDAHINSSTHPNINNGTNQKQEGHHQNNKEATDTPEENNKPWTVKRSRRPRKDKPAHENSKLTEVTKGTTQEHGHTLKAGSTLRVIMFTRSGTPIHHKGYNIKRRIIAFTPELGIKKIKKTSPESRPMPKKHTESTQQSQADTSKLLSTMNTRYKGSTQTMEVSKRT